MPRFPPADRPSGYRTRREAKREHDDRRGSSAARGYGSRWQKARLTFLAAHPLCCRCEKNGKIIPATVVDHVEPHRGDQALFWDRGNWQPLCKPCHDRDKQIEETVGFSSDVGEDGLPLDPRHPFYAATN